MPLVSICCLAYNHERYISECLDGFISQRTTFPFEVLIHDDASNDTTASIIEEYTVKFPNLIKPIYQKENQFSKGIRVNTIYNFSRAKGKYIALCEGDDYWIDPLKLQNQVDFLEKNPDYVLCHTDINYKIEAEDEIIPGTIAESDTTTIKELFVKNHVSTLTVMFRNNILDFNKISGSLSVGDWPLYVLLSQYGKLKRLPFVSGVYRIHDSNNFYKNNYLEKKKKLTESTEFLYSNLEETFRPLAKNKLIKSYYILASENLKAKNYGEAGHYLSKLKNIGGAKAYLGVLALKLKTAFNHTLS
jgi:glycosyltransferase involved in cell wall biosynthesis